MNLNLKKLDDMLDEALQEHEGPVGQEGLASIMKQLMKRTVERMLQGEMTHHLGYRKHDPAGRGTGNSRNGASTKTIQSEMGEMTIEIPRDRKGEFTPIVVEKHQSRLLGMDEKIISMYARGMSTRDIQAHLKELYGVEVSPALISEVTDEVMEEVKAWQNRPLEGLYGIVFLDALYVKIRHNGRVENRAIFVAIGVDWTGKKDVLGLWTAAAEGAKFWLAVLTELRNRGLREVLVFCVDGLKGFPEAIASVYPHAEVQQCIVHAVRASLNYVNWKERKAVAADLKPIYRAATEPQARLELERFKEKWGEKYQPIVNLWENNWDRLTPYFAFPEEIRRVIYTTNAVESLHSTMRKIIKTRGSFPNEDAAIKLLYLALKNVIAKWDTIQHWKAAMNRFQILYGDRIKAALAA